MPRCAASGKLDAAYANPNPLPFAKAEATLDGKAIKLFFELRAGGYNGSTYTLTYDPAADVLKGVYFQAVVMQVSNRAPPISLRVICIASLAFKPVCRSC